MSFPVRTPAGERVKEWFRRNATFVCRPMEALDFDEIAQVALNRKEFSGEERDPVDHPFAQELADALKSEFGQFMRTSDEEWLGPARSLLARMQARTMVLNLDLNGERSEVNGIFVYSQVDGSRVFPRAVFYMSEQELAEISDALAPVQPEPKGDGG